MRILSLINLKNAQIKPLAYSDNFGQFSVLTFINKLSISTSNICHGSSIKLTQNIQGAKGDLFSHVKEEKPRYHHCLHHLDRELPRLEFQNDRDVAESIVPEIAGSCPGHVTHEKESYWSYVPSSNLSSYDPCRSEENSTQLTTQYSAGISFHQRLLLKQAGRCCLHSTRQIGSCLLCPVSFSCFWSFLVFVLWELGLYCQQ